MAAAVAAAAKVKTALTGTSGVGPNIPLGSSRAFIDLVKAIGEAGSNHVRRVWRRGGSVGRADGSPATDAHPRDARPAGGGPDHPQGGQGAGHAAQRAEYPAGAGRTARGAWAGRGRADLAAGSPGSWQRQMKEYLVRLIYCEMLGHEASFGHFNAVKMAQSTGLLEKRVGYLASCVLLHENHELIVLLINTMQRDLQSSNLVEICMALTTISRLMNAEMTPAVLPAIMKLLAHPREIVRKKAVLALHRCYTRSSATMVGVGVGCWRWRW